MTGNRKIVLRMCRHRDGEIREEERKRGSQDGQEVWRRKERGEEDRNSAPFVQNKENREAPVECRVVFYNKSISVLLS